MFALLSSTARHSIVRKSTQQQAILADPEMALRTSNANFSLRQASLSQAFDILCKILRLKWRDPLPEVGDTQRRNECGKFEDIYVYEAAAANAAIKMAGIEVGLFTDRKDVRLVTSEYDKMTDTELAQRLAEAAKLLLAGPVIEHDGIDLIGGSPSVPPESRTRSR